MKTIYGVFAVVVFVVSLAQPAFACPGTGSNVGRTGNTTATAASTAPRPSPPPAQGAGIAR